MKNIDKFETALGVGYSPGQAAALELYPTENFKLFMEDMIPAHNWDEKIPDKFYIFDDGSTEKVPEPKKEITIRWTKSKYDDGEITLAENLPLVAQTCRERGKSSNALYTFTLCGKDKKWLKRTTL